MATSNNPLLKGVSGGIGKTIVVKQYAGKTVITSFPDMSGIKPSALQKVGRVAFKEAQRIASGYLRKHPEQRTTLIAACAEGQRPYNLLISRIPLGDKRYHDQVTIEE